MKTVKKYTSPVMAEIDRTRLLDEGINAMVLNQNVNCYVAPAGGLVCVELVVSDEDYGQAAALLGQ